MWTFFTGGMDRCTEASITCGVKYANRAAAMAASNILGTGKEYVTSYGHG